MITSLSDGDNILKSILLQENSNGHRPLELAMINGSYSLFLEILHTEGVYRIKLEDHGVFELWKYDVTEYMIGGERMALSPLAILSTKKLDEDECNVLTELHFFDIPVIQKWMQSQMWWYTILQVINIILTIYVVIIAMIPKLTLDGTTSELLSNLNYFERKTVSYTHLTLPTKA